VAEETSFRDLIRRVRAGDGAAAAELVRRYEPTLRRLVRARLTDPRLRRLLDSMDVCQSVLASFFVRAASGQYRLDQPRQLLNLLAAMARNKLAKQAARQGAARRDYRRQQCATDEALFDPGPGPGAVAADRDLLEEVRRRLSADEQQLAERRAQGRTWAEIAAEVGGQEDLLRLKFTRALDRVAQELDLDS
jgi:RNA polymerase sigma-70 factor (ECF subfamily)